MDEITAIVDSSRIGYLRHEKLKAKLLDRKASLSQILTKKRCVKALDMENVEPISKSSYAKKREVKKKKSKSLVYKVQGAQHGEKQAQKMNEIKMKHKRKMSQAKKQKIQSTQTISLPNNEIVLNDEMCDFINNIVNIKIKEAMALRPIHIKYEESLVQYANYGQEPTTGRLYVWEDVADLPKPSDPYWMMMLENRSPYNDNSYLCLSLANRMEVATIAKEREPYPEQIQNHSSVNRHCSCLYEILSFISLFGMIFAVLIHFYDKLTRRQPQSIWEWILNKLGDFLRTYFYYDMYSL